MGENGLAICASLLYESVSSSVDKYLPKYWRGIHKKYIMMISGQQFCATSDNCNNSMFCMKQWFNVIFCLFAWVQVQHGERVPAHQNRAKTVSQNQQQCRRNLQLPSSQLVSSIYFLPLWSIGCHKSSQDSPFMTYSYQVEWHDDLVDLSSHGTIIYICTLPRR